MRDVISDAHAVVLRALADRARARVMALPMRGDTGRFVSQEHYALEDRAVFHSDVDLLGCSPIRLLTHWAVRELADSCSSISLLVS